MAARGNFRITNPDKVDMTLTITMSVAEWRSVRERLQPAQSDGEWYLDDAIKGLINKASEAFSFYEQVDREADRT